MQETKFDFNDILIMPKAQSDTFSRQIIDIKDEDGFLPLITAPMDTVVTNNIFQFIDQKIKVCTPRGYNNYVFGFTSYSLDQIMDKFRKNLLQPYGKYLIDMANGHLSSLISAILTIKYTMPQIVLMVGNVANPETYTLLSEAGADYVRVGIGNGGGCLTTQNTGVGYPMASLIKECYEESLALTKPAKIVADGGMQNYSDIIKALALGADYVMVGNIFNKALESAGGNYLFKRIKIPLGLAKFLYSIKVPIYKKFRGMSTKEVQRSWGNERLKTSEGVVRYRKVEYTLSQWCENFSDYLRSAMSYSNATDLKSFIGNAEIIKISENSYKRFNK